MKDDENSSAGMSEEGSLAKDPSILIIDDDANLRKTLGDILRTHGYEITAAGCGEEGIALFRDKPADLVLIDLGLPDIPGIKVLEKIKALRPATEAIILTGNASLDTAIEATNRGAFSYLLKPYEIEQLIINARKAIGKQQAEEEIIRRSRELQRSNLVLKALHQVSQVLSRTLDMETLLGEVLKTFAGIEIFRFEGKGAAFLVDGDMLNIAASVGFSGTEQQLCETVRLGECLCGLAVSTGEIVVSRNSGEDARHVIDYPGSPPHGHLVLPLKTAETVIGALCFYTKADLDIKDWELKLLSALGGQIGIAVNNARLYGEARSRSLQDPLTGLGNRRSMQIQMEKSIEATNRYGDKLSIIMMDLDHFKQYNDMYGHPEGDRLLVRLAAILLKEMRKTDYIFRYGGEEFLAILPETDLNKAREAAERMRRAVEEEMGVTISLGVASCREETRDSTGLIRSADKALYRAKQNGRNRVEVAE